jgi:hypothetical protein
MTRRRFVGLGPAIDMLQKANVSRVQVRDIKGASICPMPIHLMGSIIQLLQDFLVVLILFIVTQHSVIRVDLDMI